MELVGKLFEVLFPVFLIIGIGYWYGKKDPKFDTKFITTFAGNFPDRPQPKIMRHKNKLV